MKAFLSYSSSDEEFVSAVADHLGRQLVNSDRFSLRAGADLID
jgi:hypothetical protein